MCSFQGLFVKLAQKELVCGTQTPRAHILVCLFVDSERKSMLLQGRFRYGWLVLKGNWETPLSGLGYNMKMKQA